MNKFYVQDPILNKIVYFDSVPKVVEHLTILVEKMYSQTRKSFMQELIDLGHGYDDNAGVTFTNALADRINIGILNKDKTHVRCNIHAVSSFNKDEYGD